MLPIVALVRFGRGWRVPLPLPFFLLWPLLPLAALILAATSHRASRGEEASAFWERFKVVLSLFYHLSGIRADVRSHDGTDIQVRML